MQTTIEDTTTSPPSVSGEQPKSRVSDPVAARRMIEDVEGRFFRRLRAQYRDIQDEYDRFPPDDPNDLTGDGRGYSTNVNWGSMAARVDETVEPMWNLAMAGDVTLKFKTDIANFPAVAEQLQILSEVHREMIDGWDDYGDEIQKLVFHRVLFGLGIAYFAKPYGWQWTALHPSNFIFVPGAGTNINKHAWCAIATEFDITDLIKVLETPDESSDTGWKLTALRTAIQKFAGGEGEQLVASMQVGEYAERWRHNDLYFSHKHNVSIQGYVFLVREWDGTVSEHLLIPHDEIGYIYSKPGKYSEFSRAIVLMPHSLGEGVLDKVRGYGVKTLPFHDALNRISNHEIDVGMLGASLITQATDATALDRLEEIQFGPITILPPDIQAQQQAFSDPTAGIRQIKADMRAQLASVNAAFGGRTDLGPNEKTAREAVLLYQDANQQQTFQVSRFKKQLNCLGRLMWNRTLELIVDPTIVGPGDVEARLMIGNALNRGFQPELLARIVRVEYVTSGGDGNRVNSILVMQDLQRFFGRMTTDGQVQFAKKYVKTATDDPNVAELFFGGVEYPKPIETVHVNHAQLENGILEASTTGVVARADDDHFIHLQTHLEFAQQKGALLSQGQADPKAMLNLVTRMLQHVSQHVQEATRGISATAEGAIRDDAKGKLKAYMEGFSQVENMRRQLAQQLEAGDNARAQQQQKAIGDALQQAQQPSPAEQQKMAGEQLRQQQAQQRHEQEMRFAEENHGVELRKKALELSDLVGRT